MAGYALSSLIGGAAGGGIKSTNHYSFTMQGTAGTLDVAIAAVNVNKSWVVFGGLVTSADGQFTTAPCTAQFLNGNTVRFRRPYDASIGAQKDGYFTVVEAN